VETRIKHVLLEVFYEEGMDLVKIFKESESFDDFKGSGIGFTYADYELCFAGEHGIVQTLDDFVGFGGELDIDPEWEDYQKHNEKLKKAWGEISRKKIKEAYEEYMVFKKEYMFENEIRDDMAD
jgi:hypothetical protein